MKLPIDYNLTIKNPSAQARLIMIQPTKPQRFLALLYIYAHLFAAILAIATIITVWS